MRPIAALTVLLALAGCTSTVPESLVGPWGGQHIGLIVGAAGAEIEYDCAHGRITEPLLPDSDGDFVALGEHVNEHGGPIHEDEVPDRHPARYIGRVRGSGMTLRVELTDTARTVGTFELERGANPNVFKCL